MDISKQEPQNIIRIRDVELGKPDAKDEAIYSTSLEEFCGRIILPPNFLIDNVLNREKFYIIGNKGVGKTALLFYIHYLLKRDEADAACSMLLFKTDISDAQRARMEKSEDIRLNNMDIPQNALRYVRDFSRLWTLVIYKKIINDNKKLDIFEDDTNWKSFVKLVTLLDENQSSILEFASQIPKNNIYFDCNQESYIAEKIQYPQEESVVSLMYFYDAIEAADKLFCSLICKKSKYYICIDELEAYYRDHETYIRDLTMIRDLIITTKRINSMLRINKIIGIKIILSVRTEIVNSISRELPGFEFNKDLGGFAEKINWSGVKLDFVYHPLLSIWIKRIQETLNKQERSYSANEIYFHMFDEIVGLDKTVDYVLDRTWNKPRDIIRFMSCISEQANENLYRYDAKSFVCCMDEYSKQSRIELVEEMGAIYSSAQIEKIFICLTAYKKHFTKEEFEQRLEKYVIKYYPALETESIINDLYRIGVVGIRNFNTGKELWGYLGQSYVESEEWRFLVHRGLWRNLELDSASYGGIMCVDIIGVSYNCKVEGRDNNYLLVSFKHRGQRLNGVIHATNISGEYIDLNECIGITIMAYVVDYNSARNVWVLSCFSKKMI